MGLRLRGGDYDIGIVLGTQLAQTKEHLTAYLCEVVAKEIDEVQQRLTIDCGCALERALQGQESTELEELRTEIAELRAEIARGIVGSHVPQATVIETPARCDAKASPLNGKRREPDPAPRKAEEEEQAMWQRAVQLSDAAKKRAVEEEAKAAADAERQAAAEEAARLKAAEELAKKSAEEAAAREAARREAEEEAAREAAAQEAARLRAEEEQALEDARRKAAEEEAAAREAARRKAEEEAAAQEAARRKAEEEAAGKKAAEEAAARQRAEAELAQRRAAEEEEKEKARRRAAEEAAAKAREAERRTPIFKNSFADEIRKIAAQEVAWQRTPQEEADFQAQRARNGAKGAGAGAAGGAAQAGPEEPKAASAKELQAAAMRSKALFNQPYDGEGPLWIVVGGEDTGGILVRNGEKLSSERYSFKLSRGTTVMELETVGNRLHYKRICGDGPDWGWVNLTHNGKALLELDSDPPDFRAPR